MGSDDMEGFGVYEGYALSLAPSDLLGMLCQVCLGKIELPIAKNKQLAKIRIA
jgi:hypothetical protein